MRLAGPPCLIAFASAALVAAGCGGETATTPSVGSVTSPATRVASTGPAGYLPAGDVDRVVGNSFRAGLQRLGVMQQPRDLAVDRGQPVPTGQLRDVACSPAGSKPAAGTWHWSCDVRWVTTWGRAQDTRYDVGLDEHGCLGAAATPARPQVRDNTQAAFSEDPLNALFAVREGC
jgi:hypothetical protein